LRRFEHTVVLAIVIELSMVLGFGAFMLLPRWRLQAFAPFGRSDYQHVREWSADGDALLTEGPPGFEVLAADGSVILGAHKGREQSVAWAGDRSLLVLEYADESTYRLFRVDIDDGHRQMIGGPLAPGVLIADGRGGVALRSRNPPVTTTILDPTDGHVVTELVGYRPVRWTNDGALILGQPQPRLEGNDVASDRLFYWRPSAEPKPIGPDLLDVGVDAPVAPSGDVVACVCVRDPAQSGVATSQIYQVPIDGSPGTILAPWKTSGSSGVEMAWLDESSLAVVDHDGFSLVSVSGGRRLVPGLASAEMGFAQTIGRVYPLRGGALAFMRDQTYDEGDSLIVVIDANGGIAMRRHWLAHDLTDIAVDQVHERAVVSGDPQFAFGPQTELFLLESK
jgi:hypothetical protein